MAKYLFYIFFFTLQYGFSQNNQSEDDDSLKITFKTNHNKGRLYISLFENENNFLKKPFKTTVLDIRENQEIKKEITDIKKKRFAIATFLDLNNNGKLDKNFMGIPKEPYGFSNNAKGLFGPPSFEKSMVILNDNNNSLLIEMTN